MNYDDFQKKIIEIKIDNLGKQKIKQGSFVFFSFSEKDLTKETGKKLLNFLKNNKVKVVKSLPRCLFGSDFNKIMQEYGIPKNCSKCLFLHMPFTEDEDLLCTGKKIKIKANKYKAFKEHYKTKDSLKKCKNCVYHRRGQCDEPCLKRLFDDKDEVEQVSNLYIENRKGKFLIIEPETASWAVLDKKVYSLFNRLSRKTLVKNLGDDRRIMEFYIKGLVKINGKSISGSDVFERYRTGYPTLCVLHVTNSCNLRCKYCYADASTGEIMPFKTMKVVIDKVIELPNKRFKFEFHGGEPLLGFVNIKKAVEYGHKVSRKKNKQIEFSMQTNGTLLDEDKINFLKKNNVGLGISLDGPREFHDKNRIYPNGKGSFDDVMRNIKLLQKAKMRFGVIMLIQNINQVKRIPSFLQEYGIKSIKLNTPFLQGRNKRDLINQNKIALEHLRIYDKFKEAVSFSNMQYFVRNVYSKNRIYMCLRSPCGAAISMMGVDVNGDVYPCEEMNGKKELVIGNILSCDNLKNLYDDSEIVKKIRSRNVNTIPKCSSCAFKNFCGGGCTNKSYSHFNSLVREGHICEYNKTIIRSLIWD